MLRTGSHTFATCLTSLFIDYRNTVYHMDRIKRTSLDTASVTETAIVTGLRTSVRYKGKHITVLCACVFVVHLCLITIALTMDKSNHTSGFSDRNAHDLTDLFTDRFTADRTGIDRGFSLCDRSSKSGTARIAAATTVITGKGSQYRFFPFIYIYFKFNTGNAKKQADQKTYHTNNAGCDQNSYKAHRKHLL